MILTSQKCLNISVNNWILHHSYGGHRWLAISDEQSQHYGGPSVALYGCNDDFYSMFTVLNCSLRKILDYFALWLCVILFDIWKQILPEHDTLTICTVGNSSCFPGISSSSTSLSSTATHSSFFKRSESLMPLVHMRHQTVALWGFNLSEVSDTSRYH